MPINSLLYPSNVFVPTAYNVDNSCRFNDGSSDNLSRSTGTPSSRQKFTFSTWIKLSSVSGNRSIFNIETDGNTTLFLMVKNGDQLHFVDYNSSAEKAKLTTTALYRDLAWYHVVLRLDSTQGTNTNRCRLYVNGEQITSFSATVYPSENYNFTNNVGNTRIGVSQGNANYWDGYLSETVYCDGQSLDPTSFGEFDEDSGIWKPIDVSGLTFGTNGFYFEFKGSGTSANSSGLGADTSGNDHHFTVTNLTAVDQSTDTCTNNFATWNSLIKTTSTLSEGNLKYAQPGSNPVFGSLSTIGVTAGKWYAELNYTSGSSHKLVLGVADETFQNGNTTASYDLGKSSTTSSIAYVVNTGDYRVNNSNTSWGSGGGDGQIINMAIDRDNGKIYFGVNGTWGNSSDPAAGSGGIPTTALDSSTNWFWGITADTSGTSDVGELNFGSPSYSESGGETDGNGYGNFANAVPSGYYVLNSKNLAEYG